MMRALRALRTTGLWRRKPSRTPAAQGVQHQWQRQVGWVSGEVDAGVGTGWSAPAAPTAGLAGVVAVDAVLVAMDLHGWVGGAADATGAAAAATGEGKAVSTASEVGVEEP
jgi:hypothetical protein